MQSLHPWVRAAIGRHFWTVMPADSNWASVIAREAVTVLLTVVNIVAADIAAADIVGMVEFDKVDSGIAGSVLGSC